MDDRASIGPRLDPRRRDEWTGINFLLAEMDLLRSKGLVLDDAYHKIVGEYSARRDRVVNVDRFYEAIGKARDLAVISPREAIEWAGRAREISPDRPEGWVIGIELCRKTRRFEQAEQLASEAALKFPDLARPAQTTVPVRTAQSLASARVSTYFEQKAGTSIDPIPSLLPVVPRVSWSSVAGEFLEEHWQKLISALAVLLIVVSSTIGAGLVLGPLLWSPAGKGVLALVFTATCAGFGVGLVRWGAERAGRMMLATSLIVIPINLMLLSDLRRQGGPSLGDGLLVALDLALLLVLTRWVVSRLGLTSVGIFTAFYFGMASFNVGASRGMPFEEGLAVFLVPCVLFLGAVSWLNRRVGAKGDGPGASHAYLEFGLLTFAFLAGVLRTGGLVLQLVPSLYAIPAMLAAIAGVSTARAIGPIEKDRRLILLFQQGGLTLSALAFALALARPPGPSALFSGNILAVALLGLSLYVTSLRATRLPAYLYCGFAALFVAYFGTYYFAADLVRSVEEAARRAMGYDRKLPLPFKAVNGLVFNVGLAWLSGFFRRRWSDDRLALHCHWIGLPLSIAACVLSGFEPKAALICLGGYAVLYAIATRLFAEPGLIYLACAAASGAAFFGAGLAGGRSLGVQSLVASGLGLVFWLIRATPGLQRAGEAYRAPLIHAARVTAALAMLAATASAIDGGAISPVATLAFGLTAILALLNGHEAPRVSIFLLAIVALLGSWLGGYHLIVGGAPTTAAAYGLLVAGFTLALLLAGEALREWFGRSRATGAYLEAVGWAVPLLVLVAWNLAGGAGVDSVTVARTVLVGSASLLWLTRFRREPVLVYLGLLGVAAWSACLCGLIVPAGRPELLMGWLAITSGGCSLVFWGVGEWVRRRDEPFYFHPCFLVAGVLALLASGLALEARWLSVDTYRLGVAAMLAGGTSLGLIAASRRWPGAVALAAGSVVMASYLAILSQGPAAPDSIWILGMLAAVESIACRGAGMLIRRGSGERWSPLARPLDVWAAALLTGAVLLGFQSPGTLLVVAVASLLMIGCSPSNRWLYGTFAALGMATYQEWLVGRSGDGLIPLIVLGAYLTWGIGLALQGYGPILLGRLGLADLRLHEPPILVTVLLGVLAVATRIGVIVDDPTRWASLPWLPWSLALLCLMMLRFQPSRAWVHAAVALTGIGYAATLSPWLKGGAWWFSIAMTLTIFWWLAGRGAERVEARLRRRLSIAPGDDSGVFRDWSLAAYGLSGLALMAVVLVATFAPILVEPVAWWDVLLAIVLAGVYVGLEGRRSGRDTLLLGLEGVGMLAVWWLVAPGTPLVGRIAINRQAYLPLSTAVYALAVVWLGRWAEGRQDGPDRPRRALLVDGTSWAGFGLGLISVYLSIWWGDWVAVGTLVLISAALGTLALGWNRVESAVLGGMVGCLASATLFVEAARSTGRFDPVGLNRSCAMGFTIGLFGLWWVARWVRRRVDVGQGGDPVRGLRVASALEWVAIGATVPSAFLGVIDGYDVWPSLAVLFPLAVFFAMVAWRRVADWPAYVAQALLLGCYFRARPILVPSGMADAIILSLLAYLDLGVSELMSRLRWSQFTRPTLRFSLVLPLVPILLGLGQEHWDGVGLFILLATGAFYALAAVRLESKIPAYLAAVLFNLFLWLGWSLMGWKMAESPQFYLIPVGFSTILLAEVNRRELGRSMVNGLRNLGLVVIYASLVAPIWQTQSFGAWLLLLLLSLAGIFVGIGLRIQSFLWLGLACFVADLTYQLGRIGIDYPLARWGVSLTLGVALMLFVAFNEKKRIVATMRAYYDKARSWE